MGMLSIEACTIRTFLVESANRRLFDVRPSPGTWTLHDRVQRSRGTSQRDGGIVRSEREYGRPVDLQSMDGSSMNHDLNEYPTLETIPVKGPALESRPTSRRSSATSSPGRCYPATLNRPAADRACSPSPRREPQVTTGILGRDRSRGCEGVRVGLKSRSLGEHGHVELVAERDDRLKQRVASFLVVSWTNKGLVDLDDPWVQGREV